MGSDLANWKQKGQSKGQGAMITEQWREQEG